MRRDVVVVSGLHGSHDHGHHYIRRVGRYHRLGPGWTQQWAWTGGAGECGATGARVHVDIAKKIAEPCKRCDWGRF